MRTGCLVMIAFAATSGACLDDVKVPPAAPTLQPVKSPTFVPRQILRGSKPKGTAVVNFETVIVPADEAETWTHDLELEVGENPLRLWSEDQGGLRSSTSVDAAIIYDRPCPGSPTFELPPALSKERSFTLAGTKPKAASLWLNEELIVALSNDGEWTHTLELPDADGLYAFSVVAKDAEDKESDPVRFSIQLDRAPPKVISRYPPVGWPDPVPPNVQVIVAFDEPLGGNATPGRLVVKYGNDAIAGNLEESLTSNTLIWTPVAATLGTGMYTVTIAATLLPDRLGNTANTFDPWVFPVMGSIDETPPAAPTVDAPASAASETVTLTGTKAAWTSIWINDDQVVAVNDATTWTYEMPLAIGTNELTIEARSVTGAAQAVAPVTVERLAQLPAAPTIDEEVATEVDSPFVLLTGGKAAGTSVLLDGVPVVCRDANTTWSFEAALVPGVNELKLQSRDEDGILSDEVLFVVDFSQDYSGTVPADFALKVFFSLRDLEKVPDIQDEFELGPNYYAIDAWLEGPIEKGETCALVDHERQNIKYVATIQSYIGAKDGKQVPWSLTDYRAPDFLAALITGGVFNFVGLGAGTDRRDAGGHQQANLVVGLTETQLRDNYDCTGEIGSSRCTQATVRDGPQQIGPWSPKARGASSLLPQGDYLLHIQLNLDRDPIWLLANDFETCWGDAGDNKRGMHRVVRRISLGSAAYTLDLPQSEEHFGTDAEGSGRLHFIGPEGVTIYWGSN